MSLRRKRNAIIRYLIADHMVDNLMGNRPLITLLCALQCVPDEKGIMLVGNIVFRKEVIEHLQRRYNHVQTIH